MKTKTYLFSNFKFSPNNKNDNDNLQIDSMINVSAENGYIESELNHGELIEILIEEQKREIVKQNNTELLKNIVRFIPYTFFEPGLNVFSERLFAISFENNLYELNNETNIFELKYNFSKFPKIIQNKNSIFLFDSNNKSIVIESNNNVSIEQIPTINSFIADTEKLYFSLELKPFSFFVSEQTELRNLSIYTDQYSYFETTVEDGQIYKIVKIKDNIFIITQFSILKYDKDNNTLVRQNNLELEIFKDTIIQLDNSVIFYSSNGLYLFDGNDIEQQIDNYLKISKNANLLCFNQNLYIFDKNLGNFIYKYNFKDKYFLPIFFDNIEQIYLIKTKNFYSICVCKKDNLIYKNLSLYNYSTWNDVFQKVSFKTTTFNSTNTKQIKDLFIKASGEATLIISSNITSTKIKICNSTQIHNLLLSGKIFNFQIESKSKFQINSILVNLEEVGD